jgi:hypothetical protein
VEQNTCAPVLFVVHTDAFSFLSSLPRPWLALITGLLAINPQDRMTLADAFQHPWALTYVRQRVMKGCLGDYLPLTDRANWHPRVPSRWRRNSPNLSVMQAILI